jgi:hypothetical protein
MKEIVVSITIREPSSPEEFSDNAKCIPDWVKNVLKDNYVCAVDTDRGYLIMDLDDSYKMQLEGSVSAVSTVSTLA